MTIPRSLPLLAWCSLAACTAPVTEPHPADGAFDLRRPTAVDAGEVDPTPTPDLGPKLPSPFPAGTTLGSLMPQVVGPTVSHVLTAPRVVAVTYDNDVNRSAIEDFFIQYAASSAWATQTSEYGVGPLTVGTPRHLSGNAPISPSLASIEQLIASHLGNGAPWGPPDSRTIYEIFFPEGSHPTDADGTCCADFEGFHSYLTTASGVRVLYAISCNCPNFAYTATPLEELTTTAGHETVEAATDPFIDAYQRADDAHAAWTRNNGGEVGDMCNYAETIHWKPSDMSYTIPRTWSNQAAAAGHDPCVGDPTAMYYQTMPYLPDSVPVKINGALTAARGITIPMGGTATLALTVFADDPAAGPFKVTIEDYSSAWSSGPKLLDITAPTTPVQAGDTIQATIKVLAADPETMKSEQFMITTTPVNGGPSTTNFGFVGQ